MHREEGKVVAVEGNYAYVAARPSSSCKLCSKNGFCPVLSGYSDLIIKAFNDMKANVGDSVLVVMRSTAFLKVSSLIYLIPLSAFLTGMIFWRSAPLNSYLNGRTEDLSLILGFISLAVSYIAVRLLSRKVAESEKCHARVIHVLNA